MHVSKPCDASLFFRTMLSLLFFFTPQAGHAKTELPLLISEVQIAGTKADDEFIEIYNPNSCAVDINGWKIKRRNQGGTETSITLTTKTVIPGKQHFLWINTTNEANAAPLVPIANQSNTKSSFLTTNNSLGLFNKDGDLIDAVTWGNNSNPFSPSISFSSGASFPSGSGLADLERDVTGDTIHALSEPTPEGIQSYAEASTNENTLCGAPPTTPTPETPSDPPSPITPDPTEPEPAVDSPLTVRINEILPNPTDKGEQGEFIELYNFGNEDINLKNWTLRDTSKTGKYLFKSDTTIGAFGYLVLYRPTSSLSLNNTDETVTLLNPKGNTVSAIGYDKAKEGVSYNYSEKGWRWSKYLTPGEENRFGKAPKIKVSLPKNIYPNIPAEFAFETDNPDYEYTWDFGDKSSKSHLSEVRHTYKKAGKYTIKASVFDGSEETTRSFSIQVKKFPAADIRITALLPNPAGGDADHEWIEFANFSNKKIDLKGWIVATGEEELVNHAIRESFVLEPKTTERLTKDFASFTLNNTRMNMELRTPDKKTIQEISYDREDGVEEDEAYTKNERGWVWQQAQAAMTEETESAPDIQTPEEELLAPEAIPEEITPPQPEIILDPELIGKQTLAPSSAQPIVSVLNYGTNIKTPDLILRTMKNPLLK